MHETMSNAGVYRSTFKLRKVNINYKTMDASTYMLGSRKRCGHGSGGGGGGGEDGSNR